MYPVAHELSSEAGILEPLQTASSVKGQVEELGQVLTLHGKPPVTLIGYSWGAWLAYLVAAYHSSFVKKLILVSSGPFEASYATRLTETRLSRLNPKEREQMTRLISALNAKRLDEAGFAKLGELTGRADSYDRLLAEAIPPDKGPEVEVFQRVWTEASELRKSGELLELGRRIQCEVIAIHGDYDPHPHEGVSTPLSWVLKNFRFVLMGNCGHEPWLERNGKSEFYRVLKEEIRS